MQLTCKVDISSAVKALELERARIVNLKPVFRKLAPWVKKAVIGHLNTGGPGGWPALSKNTKRQGSPLASQSGALRKGINIGHIGRKQVMIFPARLGYSRALHTGTIRAGKGNKTHIPARPYFFLDTSEEMKVVEDIRTFVMGKI